MTVPAQPSLRKTDARFGVKPPQAGAIRTRAAGVASDSFVTPPRSETTRPRRGAGLTRGQAAGGGTLQRRRGGAARTQFFPAFLALYIARSASLSSTMGDSPLSG